MDTTKKGLAELSNPEDLEWNIIIKSEFSLLHLQSMNCQHPNIKFIIGYIASTEDSFCMLPCP